NKNNRIHERITETIIVKTPKFWQKHPEKHIKGGIAFLGRNRVSTFSFLQNLKVKKENHNVNP
ncbi:MAG: hypothetical protein ACTSYU_11760, partial [Promethearchaeota archaeon]